MGVEKMFGSFSIQISIGFGISVRADPGFIIDFTLHYKDRLVSWLIGWLLFFFFFFFFFDSETRICMGELSSVRNLYE